MQTHAPKQDTQDTQDTNIVDILGPADATMLRALASDIQEEGTWIFGDLHAARLRALADRLDTMDDADALRVQAEALAALWQERALIERAAHDMTGNTLTGMIRELARRADAAEAAGKDARVIFVFTSCHECGAVASAATLDMELASELALLLDTMDHTAAGSTLTVLYPECYAALTEPGA